MALPSRIRAPKIEETSVFMGSNKVVYLLGGLCFACVLAMVFLIAREWNEGFRMSEVKD